MRRESHAQISSSQAERSHKQHRRARLKVVETSHHPGQETGKSKRDFRVTKPGYFNKNRMAKQREETLKRAWRNHTKTLSQSKLANAYTDLIPPFPMHHDSPVFEDDPPDSEVPITSSSLPQPQFGQDINLEHAQDRRESATTEEDAYTSMELQCKQPTLHQKKQMFQLVENGTIQAKEHTHGAAEVVNDLYDGVTDSSAEAGASAETGRNSVQASLLLDNDRDGDELAIREGPQRAAAGDSYFRSHLGERKKQRENNEGGEVSRIWLKRDHNQARVERTDDVLHRIQIETRNGSTKHRVEKRRRQILKDKAKKHEAKIAEVLQKHTDVPQETASQANLTSLSGDGRPWVDPANINAMRQFLAGPPYESEDCRNTSSTTEPVTSQEQLSSEATLVNNGSRHLSNTNDISKVNAGHDETRATQQQMEDEETLETSAHENIRQSLHGVDQLRTDYHHASLDVHEEETHTDCDIDRSMRDVAEQIRSAADVVDEVYGNTDSDRSATSSPLPKVPAFLESQQTKNSGTPLGPSRKDSLDESQDEIAELNMSHCHKRKAIRDAKEIGYESAYAPSDSGTSYRLLEQATTSSPGWGNEVRNDRPISEFPGVSMNLGAPKQAVRLALEAKFARSGEFFDPDKTTNRTSVPTDHPIGKRRRWEDEVESPKAYIRTPQTIETAQLPKWDPAEDVVASVERISDQLDRSLRIYVTSTVDIEELAQRRETIHRRLWSWSRTEQHRFHSQISRLLINGYRLQLVTSAQPSTQREYTDVSHMDCWRGYFKDGSPYWLALLSPKPAKGLSGRKVRRTEDSSKF